MICYKYQLVKAVCIKGDDILRREVIVTKRLGHAYVESNDWNYGKSINKQTEVKKM